MATKKEEREERRRFEVPEGSERKAWSKEDRESYLATREKLAPFIRDITTPARKKEEKKKDFFEELFKS